MKAIVQTRYGSPDALELRDVPVPPVGGNSVLVRVKAASVHPDVWHVVWGVPLILRLMGSGLRSPKNPVPGTDMAGVVEQVGQNVTRFKPGDPVFGETAEKFQWANHGAYAELVAVPENNLALKPANISFEQAASLPTAGYIVLMNLWNAGGIQPGQQVLVNGAAGGVGSLVVQIAKAYGAQVTGVEHTGKLAMAQRLGADRVIDYTRQDYTLLEDRYDLIVDIPCNHPFSRCRRALKPTGVYVAIGHAHFDPTRHRWLGLLPYFIRLMVMGRWVKQLPKPLTTLPAPSKVMAVLREMAEQEKVTPVIDRAFPLAQTVEAIRYMESGQTCGRIVITP